MFKRSISLFLALFLLVSMLSLPANAATAKDVYTYLVKVAKDGGYAAAGGYYADYVALDNEETMFYGVYYWEADRNVEVTIFSDAFEVTVIIPGNPSVPYTAYSKWYIGDTAFPTGKVRLTSSYNAGSFSSLSDYTGSSAYKTTVLDILNEYLPAVLEFTRLLLDEEGYTLSTLGLSGYKACKYYHFYDNGKVTEKPACVFSGVTTYTCKVCGATWTEPIDATGIHTWDKGFYAKSPTCTAPGVQRFTCTVCGTTKDQSVPALGHVWKLTSVIIEGLDDGSSGLYTCSRCQSTKTARLCASEVFTDMPQEGNWAHTPIDWAYFNGVTNGTSDTTFSPKATCTRGQVVTFLWNAAQKPEPGSTSCSFTDVKEDSYYYSAMLWAVENGITNGKSATSFAPKATCTRGEVVTFLWNAAGNPEPSQVSNPFEDVQEGKFYYKAVLWAVENGITNGKSATQFAPKANCTRAEVVKFLYNASLLNFEYGPAVG